MNGRFKLVYQPPKNNLLQENFEFAVHQYLDEREELLFENLELDLEIMREVGAFYRVLKDINTKEGLRPMPDLLKRFPVIKITGNKISVYKLRGFQVDIKSLVPSDASSASLSPNCLA